MHKIDFEAHTLTITGGIPKHVRHKRGLNDLIFDFPPKIYRQPLVPNHDPQTR